MRILILALILTLSGCVCTHEQTQKVVKVVGKTKPYYGVPIRPDYFIETVKTTYLQCLTCNQDVAQSQESLATRVPTTANSLCQTCLRGVYTADTGRCKNCKTQTRSHAITLCPRCALLTDICASCNQSLSNQPPEDRNKIAIFIVRFNGKAEIDPKASYEKQMDSREEWLQKKSDELETWLASKNLKHVKITNVLVAIGVVYVKCSLAESDEIVAAPMIKSIFRGD